MLHTLQVEQQPQMPAPPQQPQLLRLAQQRPLAAQLSQVFICVALIEIFYKKLKILKYIQSPNK